MKINEHNYQSYLLDYVDGELPEAKAQELKQYMAEHPEVAVQLELLQKTKPEIQEPVHFPNKAALYRTESQPKQSLRISWKRWMAGAAALLLLLIAARLYLQHEKANIGPVQVDQPLATHREKPQQQPVQAPVPQPEKETAQRPESKNTPQGQHRENALAATQQPDADRLSAPPARATASSKGLKPTAGTPASAEAVLQRPVPPVEPDMTAPTDLLTAALQTDEHMSEVLTTTPTKTDAPAEQATNPATAAAQGTARQADALLTGSLQKLKANKQSLDSSFTDKVLALHEKIKHPIKALNIKKISIGNVSFVFN